MVTGLVTQNLPSPKSEAFDYQTKVGPNKTTANAQIINFPALFNGLASSVLIDNQDGANPVTVRLNRSTNVITIPASGFRSFNDSWIEQVDLTGASTDTQVTSQTVSLFQLGLGTVRT